MSWTKKLPLVAILILLISPAVSAQTDCMQSFRDAFSKLKEIDPSRKGMALEYMVSTVTRSGESYVDSIKLYAFNKRSTLRSSDVTVYQDENTLVAIRPESNVIFIAKPEPVSLRTAKFKSILKFQDSLFSKMELKDCVLEPTGLRKFSFSFPSDVKKKLGISSVVYWVNESQVMVRKLQLNYENRDDQQLKSWSLDFKRVDPMYAKRPFDGTALSKVFASKNTLQPAFRKYAIVDRR